ncbi:OB-fold-containig protein [Cognatishimia sp.]|uniref:OB-fold-containig protein n=1 Tax=Cognatishimia sp. TaxID=2211648 RepID=UPI0035142705
MLQGFLTPEFFPFTVSVGLFFGLLTLELVFLMLGGSLMGDGGDADLASPDGLDADIDADLDVDFDADIADLDADFDALDSEVTEVELDAATESFSFLDWLGLGKLPAAIWLASMCLSFGVVGIGIQLATQETLGLTLNAVLAAIPAFFGARWFTRTFGKIFARAIPKVESESVSERHLGRRRGIVSQGTAARGRPAEIKVTDRFGNIQYLRAEPFRDDEVIEPGTEVIVMRHRRGDGYRIVSLSHFESEPSQTS